MTSIPAALQSAIGIAQDGRVGMWNAETGLWADFGMIGGKSLWMLGHDPQDDMFGIDQNGAFDFWNSKSSCWYNPQGGLLLNGWQTSQTIYGPDGTQWIVGTGGNVAKVPAGTESWIDCGDLGGWTLKMIAFDAGGFMWGVGTEGNIGAWIVDHWQDYGPLYPGWNAAFIGFDRQSAQWSIDVDGNVGEWNGETLVDHGLIAGWQMRWLYWPEPGAAFGTG